MNQAELIHWQKQFKAFVTEQMQQDPAHDIAHIQRVVTSGIALANKENADINIVLPACWLHDCVNVPKKSNLRAKGSILSADRAIEYLTEIKYPAHYFDAIHHAIAAHSYSANIETKTLEAKVVQDADRLDALGAVGMSRCLMLGATWESQLYHFEDPFGANRPLDDKKYCIDHFFVKLQGLVDTMKTPAGSIEAQTRWQFMALYLKQLGHETAIAYQAKN